jgi:hypothetical protein
MSAWRAAAIFVAVGSLALTAAACDRGAKDKAPAPKASSSNPASQREAGVTPMAERVAVLGVLNKRNGIVRDVALRPGQSARWKDLIVRLRACERTAPWETEQLTGAFVQVDVQRPDDSWGRAFSGWVYRESPSLNVVEHPVYDVWVKNCEMTFPAGEPAPGADASRSPSRARNSGGAPASAVEPSTPAEPTAAPTAADSNTA